jgi:asparagine synthase (glutamine-hydrolysing)
MFRYIALAWNDAIPARSAAALRMSGALQAHAAWQAHVLEPGLHVFTAGAGEGANGLYRLSPFRGVVLGRFFRRGELGKPRTADVQLTEAEIDRIVRTEGQSLINDFWGRYVALLPASGASHVLRDPSGALPCYRLQLDGVGIAFSWLEGLLEALPGLPLPGINWDGVAAHLAQGQLSGVATALDEVFHVPAGEVACLDTESAAARPLWDAGCVARHPIDEPPARAAGRLRQTVRACARAWTDCHDAILLRLSGGLDSAILLGSLDRSDTRALITCVNYHSPGSDSDERPYARSAAKRAGRPLIERECDAGYPLERVLSVALTPAPESYVGRLSMGQMDAELAAVHGAGALFTGGGGDQLFFEQRCTWPGADYLQLRGLDGGFLSAMQDAARLGRVSVWRAMRRAIVDGYLASATRGSTGSRLTLAPEVVSPGFRPPERFVHPCLARADDLPIGKLKQLRQLVSAFGYYDPYLREAAPELVNPLLSQPLIELCLGLPTYLLTHGGRGRALARHAFADDIPPQIANRRSKGGMEEHLTEVLHRNLPFVRELLLDGQLVEHGLLDRARLEDALSGRPSTVQAHVGEIHGYVAVEAWLQRWSCLHRARKQ